MQPHHMLDGTCPHGSSNFCEACDRESYPERYRGATIIPNGRMCGECKFYSRFCKENIGAPMDCRTCDWDPCRYIPLDLQDFLDRNRLTPIPADGEPSANYLADSLLKLVSRFRDLLSDYEEEPRPGDIRLALEIEKFARSIPRR